MKMQSIIDVSPHRSGVNNDYIPFSPTLFIYENVTLHFHNLTSGK